MAEWHQLSESQQHHANAIIDLYNSLEATEKEIFNSIKHDYEAAKNWLEKHPRLKGGAITMAGLTGVYIAKRLKMGR